MNEAIKIILYRIFFRHPLYVFVNFESILHPGVITQKKLKSNLFYRTSKLAITYFFPFSHFYLDCKFHNFEGIYHPQLITQNVEYFTKIIDQKLHFFLQNLKTKHFIFFSFFYFDCKNDLARNVLQRCIFIPSV